MVSVHTSQINLKIQSFQPDHVVLHIGGHDLDVAQVIEQYCVELEFKLVLLAETFISIHRLQSLIICELSLMEPITQTDNSSYYCRKAQLY